MRIVWIVLGLLYILFPHDLLPDFLFGPGWIDDILVAWLLWRYVFRPMMNTRGSGDRREQGTGGAPAGTDSTADPHAVLGVEPDAGPEEIRHAYRRLAAQYHPDKVAHLGEDFQRLAEEKFKAIQKAYDTLASSRNNGSAQ